MDDADAPSAITRDPPPVLRLLRAAGIRVTRKKTWERKRPKS